MCSPLIQSGVASTESEKVELACRSVTLEKCMAALVWLRLQGRDASDVPNHQPAWRRAF